MLTGLDVLADSLGPNVLRRGPVHDLVKRTLGYVANTTLARIAVGRVLKAFRADDGCRIGLQEDRPDSAILIHVFVALRNGKPLAVNRTEAPLVSEIHVCVVFRHQSER
jgi:hypothetical protein